ncbi:MULTISPECIES: HNH endonuclease [Amycolatopsis]|uniref:HNH endonuclease n=1 Tax=Amycolatopsis TaxID=1813 RepID=UPI003570D563
MRPRGLKQRHLSIEIDHVTPVAGGGSNDVDNLRLACGWCNQVKSRYASLYDVATWPARHVDHPSLGWMTLPQPFWVLRIVSMRGRCEHPDGCSARLATDELFAAPARARGTLNPVNVRVYCHEHDPWSIDRLVSPALLEVRV